MTQAEALTILKTGANVFLTGEPGSGKTHTINEYVAWLRSCGIEPAITASTGIAATHIGGFTIHSWSGIGIKRALSAYDLDRIGQNKNVVNRVGSAHVLIIDEVSMLSAGTLSMVDAVCRDIRRSTKPFGSLQVVLVGDFFQLPPVSSREESKEDDQEKNVVQSALLAEGAGKKETRQQFAFSSPAWSALNPLVCYLSEQHRQEDAAFLDFLTAVRRASVVEEHYELLRTRYSPRPKPGVTQLYSHNANVDSINSDELSKLDATVKQFQMSSSGGPNLVEALKRGCLSPEVLQLKVGARVMFTKNDAPMRRYVNGTLGTVVGFAKESGFPLVKTNAGKVIEAEVDEWRVEDAGRVLARITQVPLRLAWAMTVHKSQGMSLDAAHMDLSKAFEYGQGYVALSRVRTLAGLSLAGLNERALQVHPEILLKDAEFKEVSALAGETFGALPKKELEAMHTNFVRACGGEVGKGRTIKKPKVTGSTYEITKELVLQQKPLKEIAKERGVTLGTIISHLEKLVAEKKLDSTRDLSYIELDPTRFADMEKAFKAVYKKEKKMPLSAAIRLLGNSYRFDELRLARLFVKVQ